LRRLADGSAEYLKTKPFPQFWKDGQEIASDLNTRINHARAEHRKH
jgi:hypothetical protein